MVVRYETYCGGRLLRVIEQVDVSGPADPPSRRKYVDGSWSWEVDRREVARDVAAAMLAKAGEDLQPPPSAPLVVA